MLLSLMSRVATGVVFCDDGASEVVSWMSVGVALTGELVVFLETFSTIDGEERCFSAAFSCRPLICFPAEMHPLLGLESLQVTGVLFCNEAALHETVVSTRSALLSVCSDTSKLLLVFPEANGESSW